MDDIAIHANVTKRTLYRQFSSKDDLMKAALAQASEFALRRLQGFNRPADPQGFIKCYIAEIGDWAAKPKRSLGGFTRFGVELADLRGHPARAIARRHKTDVERWLTKTIAAAGVRSAAQCARQIMILAEGAIVLGLIHQDGSYARAATAAAKALIREHTPARLRRSPRA
jgi:AcrR family transcriptional regulator